MKATRNALMRLEIAEDATLPFPLELVTPQEIDRLLGDDAVHQGVLLEASPLKAAAAQRSRRCEAPGHP